MHLCRQMTLQISHSFASAVSRLIVCSSHRHSYLLGRAYTKTNNMLLCTNANAHKELVTGVVAGSVVGGLALLVIVVVLVLWLRRFQDLPPLQFGFFHKVEREH